MFAGRAAVENELLLQCQKRPTTVSKETYYTAVEDELRALFDSVKVLEDALV